jgi:uncharacterized protein (TIGR03000 family)
MGNAFSCHGCCGGCYGCFGCGGCAGCSGCWGVTYGVFYGSSCFGGCFGGCGGCGGCYGFYGSSYGYLGSGAGGAGSCYGCAGSCYGSCYGSAGSCYGSCAGSCHGGTAVHPEMKKEKLPEPKKEGNKMRTALERQASVVVVAPLDVRVTVEGQPTERTSVVQTFVTPDLEPGQTYSYLFRAEAEREGQTVTRTRRVLVRAGEEFRVDFSDMVTAGNPKPEEVAHLTVLLPTEAKLFVDDVVCPLTSSRRTFDTPRLEPGRTYAYTLRAELQRDGQALSETRRVIVEAGRSVTVEFKDLTVQSARR